MGDSCLIGPEVFTPYYTMESHIFVKRMNRHHYLVANWHKSLFQRSYNVIWMLWTLNGPCFGVNLCLLDYFYITNTLFLWQQRRQLRELFAWLFGVQGNQEDHTRVDERLGKHHCANKLYRRELVDIPPELSRCLWRHQWQHHHRLRWLGYWHHGVIQRRFPKMRDHQQIFRLEEVYWWCNCLKQRGRMQMKMLTVNVKVIWGGIFRNFFIKFNMNSLTHWCHHSVTSNFKIFFDFKCAYTTQLRIFCRFRLSFCRAGLKNRAAWVAALLGPDLPVQDRKNRPISYDASGT